MTALSKQPKTRRDTYHHNGLRDAALRKAVQLISERGAPSFSLRELATSLGVSHTAVYRHFADKDALLREVTALGFHEMTSYQQKAQARSDGTPLGRLLSLCDAYLAFAREQQGYFALMFHSRPTSETTADARDELNTVALGTLVKAVRAAQESGDIIAGDPERLAAYLVLAPHGLASYQAQGHVPSFIARQATGPLTEGWIALLTLQPLLTRPMPPQDLSLRFFS